MDALWPDLDRRVKVDHVWATSEVMWSPPVRVEAIHSEAIRLPKR